MDKFNEYAIRNKSGNMVKFVPNEHQKRLFEEYYTLEKNRLLIMKARQVGSTTAFLAICHAAAVSGKNVIIVTYCGEETGYIKSILSNFYNHSCCTCRCHNRKIPRGIQIISAGSKIEKCQTSADVLYCTEVAYWRQGESKIHELMRLVRDDGSIIIESTPNDGSWFNNVFCNVLNNKLDPSWNHWAKDFHTMLLS